ncbi:Bromodomain-containing protein, partial [Ramicandelaber brevisporus]
FMELPSREDYPDYYKVIPQPISFDCILNNIKEGKYKSFAEFEHDCRTLFANAMFYNERGSPIYNDAKKLEAMFNKTRRELT